MIPFPLSLLVLVIISTNALITSAQLNADGSFVLSPMSYDVVPSIMMRVGILIPQNDTDYELQRLNAALNCAGGAIPIALERLWREGNLPTNVNFSFVWHYDHCDGGEIAGYSYDLFTQQQIDVLIAPPCPRGAAVAATLATFNNVPVLFWGNTMASNLLDTNRYPSAVNIMPNYADFAHSILDLFDMLGWSTFAFIYQGDDNGGASSFAKDLNLIISNHTYNNNSTLAYQYEVDSNNASTLPKNATRAAIKILQGRARIVLLCFDDIRELRKVTLGLFDAGMHLQNFVFVIVDHDLLITLDTNRPQFWYQTRRYGNELPPDGRDQDAKQIGLRSFIFTIDVTGNSTTNLNFTAPRVLQRTAKWPFELTPGTNMSVYAPFLYDIFYLYGLALGKIYNASTAQELASKSSFRNGAQFTNYTKGIFEGATGTVRMTTGYRRGNFGFSRYYQNGTNALEPLMQVMATRNTTNFTLLVDNSTLWAPWGGLKPLAIPLCGFDGNGCPVSTFEQYKEYFISGASLLLVILFCSVFLVSYIIRMRMEELRRLDASWRISYMELCKWQKQRSKVDKSARSLSSGPSQNVSMRSNFSQISLWNRLKDRAYTLREEKCISQKLLNCDDISDLRTLQELRAMRQLDHEHLCRFFGICMDLPAEEQNAFGTSAVAFWRYCPRGSLRDILTDGRMGRFGQDAVFIESLASEIIEGLRFLHTSPIQYHGRLHPTHCLLDQNWKVKLTQFGLISLKGIEARTGHDKLWLAPELLRRLEYGTGSELLLPTVQQLQMADIFDLGLVLCEMVNGKACWDEVGMGSDSPTERRHSRGNRESSAEEHRIEQILSAIRRGGVFPKRPVLSPQIDGLNPGMLLLIRDCWKEDPNERPKIELVRNVVRQMRVGTGSSRNVMDHVFGMLEQYAERLESEVDERTRELAEEKLKADTLLSRLLPREVANRLKLGESVAPEHFDSATVFFSDLCSFTAIAARLSPLGVVHLVNQLFTTFDAIIEEHDIYKVETIGDGYLCVSGLPRRNGNEHARHIADMALKFVTACNRFTLPELGNAEGILRIRIGIHTGPVVAGVVGLAMPRYCLFGDTVNTASRMETNSLPDRIQLTPEANHFLTTLVGGYRTESRGEVIIKGKGVMQTFWLLGHAY